ncbi:MAG: phosphate uptake regulator PhoU [Thaumarchaeota archaeon]|nr:phosphate uptake regulator PhoU [Nitrososphaerota archaeon]
MNLVRQYNRKVQKIGPSSLAVALPLEWAREMSVDSSCHILIDWMSDGALSISAKASILESRPSNCVIPVNRFSNPKHIYRSIVSLYLHCVDQIILISQDDMSAEFLSILRAELRRLHGVDIIYKSPRKVIIQCFLDQTKYLFTSLQKRLYQAADESLEQAIYSLEQNKESPKKVLVLEDEVDRLYWLALRQLLFYAERRDVAIKIGMSARHVVDARLAIKVFKKIGDYSKDIALNMTALSTAPRTYLPERLLEWARSIRMTFNKAADAYFAGDVDLANTAIEESTQLEAEFLKIGSPSEVFGIALADEMSNDGVRHLLAIYRIIDDLIHVARSSNPLGEVTINRCYDHCNWCDASVTLSLHHEHEVKQQPISGAPY